jgi:hypothetical protein
MSNKFSKRASSTGTPKICVKGPEGWKWVPIPFFDPLGATIRYSDPLGEPHNLDCGLSLRGDPTDLSYYGSLGPEWPTVDLSIGHDPVHGVYYARASIQFSDGSDHAWASKPFGMPAAEGFPITLGGFSISSADESWTVILTGP